ncbi:MAG: hypothetical protein Q4C60_07545 [Eubacteriales bacterium]|nr:hypothetical protein [Eubacteriales bacterium]
MIVIVDPDRQMLDSIVKSLNDAGENAQSAIQQALNDTLKTLKNDWHSGVRADYTIRAGSFRKSDIKTKNATRSRLIASATVRGPVLSAYANYKRYKNTVHKAARLQVKRDAAAKALQLGTGYKAFVATMSNGHTGIFQRVPGTQMKKKKNKEKIKEIIAMSAAKAAEKTYERRLKEETQDHLRLALLRHMNRALAG